MLFAWQFVNCDHQLNSVQLWPLVCGDRLSGCCLRLLKKTYAIKVSGYLLGCDSIMRNRVGSLRLKILLVVLAATLCGSWLGSGREILTKSSRAVEVRVRNELFGDAETETRFVRGPIFGYYVGLDVVVVTGVFFLIAVMVYWARQRMRDKSVPKAEQGIE